MQRCSKYLVTELRIIQNLDKTNWTSLHGFDGMRRKFHEVVGFVATGFQEHLSSEKLDDLWMSKVERYLAVASILILPRSLVIIQRTLSPSASLQRPSSRQGIFIPYTTRTEEKLLMPSTKRNQDEEERREQSEPSAGSVIWLVWETEHQSAETIKINRKWPRVLLIC